MHRVRRVEPSICDRRGCGQWHRGTLLCLWPEVPCSRCPHHWSQTHHSSATPRGDCETSPQGTGGADSEPHPRPVPSPEPGCPRDCGDALVDAMPTPANDPRRTGPPGYVG